tara:strand:- start:387 stop:524 length:138 start_codon:yes stop_codon:yes gene_type:complete
VLDKTIETLKEQLEHHKIMMIKAQGAIEVLEQLKNEEESSKKDDK